MGQILILFNNDSTKKDESDQNVVFFVKFHFVV
jgi:hypothetical protein